MRKPYRCPQFFGEPWKRAPVISIDFETTGKTAEARPVQVGLARFENEQCVASYSSLINPGVSIPADATEVHHITDDHVRDAASLDDVFRRPAVLEIFAGAQPLAYNAYFDRAFIPVSSGLDLSWPFLDPIILVRLLDRFATGAGRHKLPAACERHGIHLVNAHEALSDARAAGLLFYKLAEEANLDDLMTMGEILEALKHFDAQEFVRFNTYVWSRQQEEF